VTHAFESGRASTRSVPRGLAPGAVTAVVTTALGSVNGGYFPTSWGWTGLALAWIAVVWLLLRDEAALGGLPLAFTGVVAAYVGWVALSTLWTSDVPQTVREIERDVLYVAGALTLVLVARTYARALLGGLLTGIVAVCGYALLTRLLPDRLGVFDPVAAYRLSTPVGYWNALGLLAAMGSLLALGALVWTRSGGARAGAAAALVVLLPTQYFTFSRGAWLALAIGVVVLVALEPRQLRLLAAAAAVAPAPAVALVLAWRSPGLTQRGAELAAAAHDGHRVALALVGLAIVAAVVGWGFGRLAEGVRVPAWVERAAEASIAAAVVLAVAVALAAYGSPTAWPGKGWDAFSAAPTPQNGNLNERLFSFSGNGRITQWRVAADDVRDNPVLGSGAGSSERYWNLHRPVAGKVRDVHNLYLEVLAELGPVGLALLCAFLALPLVALRRARRAPYAAAAAAAYVAYLAHAAVDWDWEMPVLTLGALLCGSVLLVARRDVPRVRGAVRTAAFVAAAVVTLVAFVGLVGNIESSRAGSALQAGDWARAETHARRAHRWMPWSPDPYRQLGEAQRAQGRFAEARTAFEHAIAKDSRDWESWLDLARATTGGAQRDALRRVAALDPLSPELAEFLSELKDGWALVDEIQA
jgi:hypothetical protein